MEEEFELEQTDQIIPQQKHRSRVWKFLKPNIRNIIFFLILALPWIVNLLGQFLHIRIIPARFVLLNMYIRSVYGFFERLIFPPAFILCGGWHGLCQESLVISILVSFLIYLFPLLIIWFLACFLAWLWVRLFGLFKTKAKFVEIVVALAFFVVFIAVFLIWPLLITKTAVIIERDTREDFLMSEGKDSDIFELQQVILKNQSIMPVLYTLPPVTVCMYDRDQKDSEFVVASYVDLTGHDREAVELGSRGEEKFFLTVIENIRNYDSGGYYDQFLIFYDVGSGNRSFCETLSDQNIRRSEEVEIIRQPLGGEKEDGELPVPTTPEKIMVEGIERCEEITFENRRYNPELERDDCLRELSFKTLEASVCDYFDSDISREVCKTKIAAKKADQAICEQIVSKENKARCRTAVEASQKGAEVCAQISDWENLLERSYCFFYLAEARLEPNLCENIEVDEPGFNQTHCYRDIAFVKENILICDKIEDPHFNSQCKIRVILQIQDASLCEKLPSLDQGYCYTELAKLLRDKSFCELISGDRDECYSEVAKVTKDENICGLITKSGELLKICYPEDDPSLPPVCYTVPNAKGFCYRDLAAIKKDISVCDHAPEDINKDLCYVEVLEVVKDISICPKIEDPYEKDFCYVEIAIDQKNSGICQEVVYKKDRCYARVAEVNNDISLCENVSEKENCYYDVATFTKNSSICDLISDPTKKQKCYSDVHYAKQGQRINRKIF